MSNSTAPNVIHSLDAAIQNANLTTENTTMNTSIVNNKGEITTLTQEQLALVLTHFTNVNKNMLLSTMTSVMYHNGLSPAVAMTTSAAFVASFPQMSDGYEDFVEAFTENLSETVLDAKDMHGEVVEIDEVVDGDAVMVALVKSNYLTEEGIGFRFMDMILQSKEAYKPVLASEGIDRRFGYSKTEYSELFVEFIHALEATEFTVDARMLELQLKVIEERGGVVDYVLLGCMSMDEKLAYISEFHGDLRLRGYQACCHGPNGQSDDKSRALMNFFGVESNYDIQEAIKLVAAEMEDMVGNVAEAVKELGELGDIEFAKKHDLPKSERGSIGKCYSFIKANWIMEELVKGNRPYIGMGFGLDAKCSGPQLGALITGDGAIAAACGFTLQQLDDAYMLAIKDLNNAGFYNITRSDIKTAYMAVFYGMGWPAFTSKAKVDCHGLWLAIYPDGLVTDDIAKKFHACLSKSFGSKMAGIRAMLKRMGKVTQGRTKYQLPDGSYVSMNYKHSVDVANNNMEWDSVAPDVAIRVNMDHFKLIKPTVKTLEVNVGDFARNGFVNLIQATDALLARLIVVAMKRAGVKHIISIHDCFRVNVHDMAKLQDAIKWAYTELFGSDFNNATKDLPLGTDIIGLYFEGANKQLIEGVEPVVMSQFYTKSNKRRNRKVNGVALTQLIEALGQTYYFDK
tara:strand:+ start:184 stop:2232 length:2049 start_codon:yes stop_codon:yes gene_type:complete